MPIFERFRRGSSEQAEGQNEESAEREAARQAVRGLLRNLSRSFLTEDVKTYRDSLGKLGDEGIEIAMELLGRDEVPVSSVLAFLLGKDSKGEKAREALESFIAGPASRGLPSWHRGMVLDKLEQIDSAASIPILAGFAGKAIQEIKENLNDKSKELINLLHDDSFFERLETVKNIVDHLQKFSDKSGFEEAIRLYEEYKKVIVQVAEARKESFALLKESFLKEPVQPDFTDFEGANPESAETINSIINGIEEARAGGQYFHLMEELSAHGESAVPFVFQAMRDRRISRSVAVSLFLYLARPNQEKYLPMWHSLLLESAESHNSDFFQFDILPAIARFRRKESIYVIAEFARLSAELALATESEDAKHVLRQNVGRALAELQKFRSLEARKISAKISFIFPEYIPLYGYGKKEKGARPLPKLEKPKTREQHQWKHNQMYIKGSALFAELLERGREKVHDVDIFVTFSYFESAPKALKVGNFEKIEDLRPILDSDEFEKLKSWIERHGYAGKAINLVRVPESYIEQEASFNGEPKALIWDRVLEEEGIDTMRYSPEDLEKYRNGEFVVNGEIPEQLIPNGTLGRALRLLDLGERFGLNVDLTMLQAAETAARNGKLVISEDFLARDRRGMGEGMAANAIDPQFMNVFKEKKLRRLLLRNFPRLGQIAEDIAKAGSTGKYIEQNYGTAYLASRSYVYLYDINLTGSEADIERQKLFINEWYTTPTPVYFNLDSMERISDNPNLPKPNMEEYLDQNRLKEAEANRQKKNAFLDKLAGRYKISLEMGQGERLRRKINSFLNVMNLEWPTNMDMDKVKVTQTLIKLGVHPKNPVLAQFEEAKKSEVDLVISVDSVDILGASTYKPWESCVRFNSINGDRGGAARGSLYDDIECAAAIAYLIQGDQYIARILIRAGFSLDTFEPAAATERIYGDPRYEEAMRKALVGILNLNHIKTHSPMATYPYGPGGYFDSADGTVGDIGNALYYTRGYKVKTAPGIVPG